MSFRSIRPSRGMTTRTSSPSFFRSIKCTSAPSKCSASVTTLSRPGCRRSASTTKFSPVLVLAMKPISDGFALISDAKSGRTSGVWTNSLPMVLRRAIEAR